MIERHASLPSTNDRAKELAKAGAASGTIVLADTQTQGRGRRGRSWSSPPGAGIYASIVLRPLISTRDAGLLSIACAVALVEAIDVVCPGVPVGLKWPNDLLARDDAGAHAHKKLAGILLELESDRDRIQHAIAGFGINMREVERPAEIESIATSLEALTSRVINADRILEALAARLVAVLALLENNQAPALLARWTARALGLNTRVTVKTEPNPTSGVLLGLAEDGALRLATEDGERRIYSGDLALTDPSKA